MLIQFIFFSTSVDFALFIPVLIWILCENEKKEKKGVFMSRYRGPRFEKIRRLGALPGLTSKRPRS
jgi:hypothetical protein